MTDHTPLLGKLLFGMFILECLGMFLVLTVGSSNIPGASSKFTDAMGGLNSFTSLINGTTTNIATAFSGCSFSTMTCSKPLSQLAFDSSNSIFSSITNAVIWMGNILITLVDLGANALWFAINLLALLVLMFGLFGYIFLVFLPTVLVAAGPIGWLLTTGYVFIICLAGYKYGQIILDLVAVVLHAFGL